MKMRKYDSKSKKTCKKFPPGPELKIESKRRLAPKSTTREVSHRISLAPNGSTADDAIAASRRLQHLGSWIQRNPTSNGRSRHLSEAERQSATPVRCCCFDAPP